MSIAQSKKRFSNKKGYPKLVRDKIPEIIKEREGKVAKVRILENHTEYESYLRDKVREEATELAEAKTDSQIIEEIADIEELIDALLAFRGLDRKQAKAIQAEKLNKRGGFSKRILMLEDVNN